MAQRMPLQLTVSCFSKIQIGLPFWYRLTQVVLDKVLLSGCVCVLLFVFTSLSVNPQLVVQTFDSPVLLILSPAEIHPTFLRTPITANDCIVTY